MINLNKSEQYLVAVSGGPDSMFLLNNIKNYKIVVCHVNYHFREDSDRDQKIVEAFCQKHGIKYEILNITTDYTKLKQNFEEFAREVRYNFFTEIGVKYKISNLLVGHNFNDLVETYIMQKQRQNNVDFFGLRPVTTYKNLTVIRPILNLVKSEIIKNLEENGISYANDITNSDTKYLRNSIRKELTEDKFAAYRQLIDQENKELELLKNEVDFYTLNNLSADELILQQKLFNFSQEKIQRIIFKYFAILKKGFLLQKRKHKTVNEIAQRIKSSTKPFWKIQLNEFFLVKDFDRLYLVPVEAFNFKTVVINSKADLHLVEEFINWLEIFNAIKSDGESYPYVVSNDYETYKQITTVGFAKTNRYLIENKIPYRKRIFKAVVYQQNERRILNKMTR
ncbi:tRNA lysidine(34) synthetase TilS [Mesoplasma seiffertii]|uniref:tRNA lysidine(34) synthetase TilS n=1 Tax=Mesoplasma seiffertii TaxID=28224 RepID=UPI00047A8E80|nr:tRNA lysidine(34) synthetase TilS [Mesoplasma seiffertii]